MNTLRTHIQQVFGLDEEKMIEKMESLFVEESLAKGDFLVQQNGICNKMCFVKSGYLRVYAYVDGKEVTQWISGSDYFLTELSSFMFGTESRFNIQAITPVEIYSIHKDKYLLLNQQVKGWTELEKMFLVRCFTTMENRIFGHLAMSAEERYKVFFETNKDLFQNVPLQYIASMLGMTPETFSRVRKKHLK